jgi:hypothetical protein
VGLSAETNSAPQPAASANVEAAPTTTPAPVATAPSSPVTTDTTTETDHERVIRGIGVGVVGTVDTATLSPTASSKTDIATAPVIGLRYWMSNSMGLEFGVGVAHHSGTSSNDIPNKSNVEDPTYWGFLGHAAVPLALFNDKHYTFLLLPEANFGFATWRQEDDKNKFGDQGVDGHDWLLQAGIRAGAEVHFGFIGVPMLSLTAAVGAHVTYQDSRYSYVDTAGREVHSGHYGFDVTTGKYNDPWNIFTSSISALYYFK